MTTTWPQPITSAPPDRGHQTVAPVIAFLGAGRMGSRMAANHPGCHDRHHHAGRRACHRTGRHRAGRPASRGPGMIWVQMASVGAEWTARLAGIADARGRARRCPCLRQ
jgi:hypothetical protein